MLSFERFAPKYLRTVQAMDTFLPYLGLPVFFSNSTRHEHGTGCYSCYNSGCSCEYECEYGWGNECGRGSNGEPGRRERTRKKTRDAKKTEDRAMAAGTCQCLQGFVKGLYLDGSWSTCIMSSSSTSCVRDSRFSSPVKFSGAKNRCGRSQELSVCCLAGELSMGAQSMESMGGGVSALILISPGFDEVVGAVGTREGTPNTGLDAELGALRCGLKAAMISRSVIDGNAEPGGDLGPTPGVEAREPSAPRWDCVSMSRIGGGGCTDRKIGAARRAIHSRHMAVEMWIGYCWSRLGTFKWPLRTRQAAIDIARRENQADIWHF